MQLIWHKTVVFIFLITFLWPWNSQLAEFLKKIQSSQPPPQVPLPVDSRHKALYHTHPWAWELSSSNLWAWSQSRLPVTFQFKDELRAPRYEGTKRHGEKIGASWLLFVCNSLMISKLTSNWKWIIMIDFFTAVSNISELQPCTVSNVSSFYSDKFSAFLQITVSEKKKSCIKHLVA